MKNQDLTNIECKYKDLKSSEKLNNIFLKKIKI